jgi:hypothetical protein
MTNNLLPVLVTTNATECACGEADCFFCEPFAGLTDEEAWDVAWACPKCDFLFSEGHEEGCRYGIAAERFAAR